MDRVDELVKEILCSDAAEVKELLSCADGSEASRVLEALTGKVRRWLLKLGGRLLSELVQRRLDGEGVGRRMSGVHDYRQRSWQTVAGELRLCRGTRKGRPGEFEIPADRLLGLGASQYTAELQWLVALMSTDGAYAREMDKLRQLLGIEVTPFRAEEIVAEHGQRAIQAEQREQEAVFARREALSGCAPAAAQLVVGIDAANYRSRERAGEPWKEMKIGSVRRLNREDQRLGGGAMVAEMDKQRIGRQLYIEALRQGMTADTELVTLADGAAMNWNLFAEHFPNRCAEILDFYHASEHVSQCAHALFGEGTAESRRWAKTQRRRLLKGQVRRVLRELRSELQRLGRRRADTRKTLSANIRYFSNNQHRMAYPQYRAKGYPIGSGFVESACKQIVTSRLKGPGMRWRTAGAVHIAKLRALALSGRLYDFILHAPSTYAA